MNRSVSSKITPGILQKQGIVYIYKILLFSYGVPI